MPVRRAKGEEGFTMIMTMIGLALIATLVLAAVTAVGGEVGLTGYDLSQKRAYEAAKAGINDYAYNLHQDNGYWSRCTNVPAPSAVNQKGSTAKRRAVPGNSGATYALELIPATGQSTCDGTSLATATVSMLESLEPWKGTFRIRSTGFSGNAEASITATFKPASFLDYVYFTQLETSDPVTYGSETAIKGAYEQCAKTIQEGRTTKKIPGTSQYCRTISFVGGDLIKGPLHTNDALVVCQEPTFGRTASDPIEVSSPPTGWYSTGDDYLNASSNCTGKPKFVGTYRTNSAVLIPPTTNSQLATIAEPQFRFSKQVKICLNGESMTVNTSIKSGSQCNTGGTVLYSGSIPENGVVYVSSGTCTGAYSPFLTTYPETSECGNVYVRGDYSGQLTIAAENDIVIEGNLNSTSSEGMLGLIANNFIRVYHPVKIAENSYSHELECKGNETGTPTNMEIDAAILAINHSFIVDNYDCGNSLGTLHVLGAISQKYRGAVGTTGGTGYIKDYVYDDRLHTITPPSFIEPVQSDWVIGRETID
ncbi:MAG: hypothetical protein AB7T48_01495 [Solirubrobacterales bacterium]